jgi:hypothetical protein
MSHRPQSRSTQSGESCHSLHVTHSVPLQPRHPHATHPPCTMTCAMRPSCHATSAWRHPTPRGVLTKSSLPVPFIPSEKQAKQAKQSHITSLAHTKQPKAIPYHVTRTYKAISYHATRRQAEAQRHARDTRWIQTVIGEGIWREGMFGEPSQNRGRQGFRQRCSVAL